MAVVWLATDERLMMETALKFLPGMVVEDPEALHDFRREITRGLRLTHPGIVRVHDLHEDSGERLAAIAMEFVDGATLAEAKGALPDRCFDPPALAGIVAQLCDVLSYVHEEARVVHRDLKPRNLMLTGAGRLKVTDFGIAATLSDSHSRLTNVGSSGTPAYMSPQQVLGHHPSAADDIYAIGATLYELLTGKPPFFRGTASAILHQVTSEVPPPLDARRTELGVSGRAPIDAAWEEVVQQCLQKDPARRPNTVREIGERLALGSETGHDSRRLGTRPIHGRPAGGRPVVATPSGATQRRVGPLSSIALVLTTLLLAVGGAAYWWRWSQEPQVRLQPQPNLAAEPTPPAATPAPPSPQSSTPIPAPPTIVPATPLPEPITNNAIPAATATPPPIAKPAATPVPKPRFVLRHRFTGVAGSGSGEYGGQFGPDLVFSPDSRLLAVRDREAGTATIRAWDLESGASPWKFERSELSMLHFDFSPDSRRFVVGSGDYGDLTTYRGGIIFADAATGRVYARHAEPDIFAPGGLLFSPDNGWLITWSRFHGTIDVWDCATGERRGRLPAAPGRRDSWIEDVQVAGDSSAFAAGGESQWGRWSLPNAKPLPNSGSNRALLPGALRRRSDLIDESRAFSAAIKRTAEIRDAKTIELRDENNAVVRTLPAHRYDRARLGFSPDGEILASLSFLDDDGDAGVRASEAILWDARTWEQLVKLPSSGDSMAAFSPDGRYFVLASGDITVFAREPAPSEAVAASPFAPVRKLPAATGSATPAPIRGSPLERVAGPPPPIQFPQAPHALSKEFLREFCARFQADEQTHDLDRIILNYATKVDYLEEGVIGQAAIRQDKKRYFDRWPKTTGPVKGEVTVLEMTPRQAKVRYLVDYSAENTAGDRVTGVAEQTIEIVLSDRPRVVWERGKVLSREKSSVRSF